LGRVRAGSILNAFPYAKATKQLLDFLTDDAMFKQIPSQLRM